MIFIVILPYSNENQIKSSLDSAFARYYAGSKGLSKELAVRKLGIN